MFIILEIFFATCIWGISPDIFSHVVRLNQSRVSENTCIDGL